MSRDWPLRRIVIAGGGTAGWMTAAMIAKTLGRFAEVTLVESEAIGTVGVGESTIPPLRVFNNMLDIDEAEFMRETRATFKLGIMFENWRLDGTQYFHSFGATGHDHWSAPFHNFWLESRERGNQRSFDDYALELKAAMESKFAHLPDDKINYAYQLDASAYARFLRRLAEKHGAQRIEGRIGEVELNPESGNIAALKLDGDRRIEGDIFIDCTGFRALLIEGALHAGYDDWTHWLPCDSAIAVQTTSVGPAVPYTRAIAHGAGWQWRIPLQHRTGNGLVYSSRYLDKEQALERFYGNIEGERLIEPNFIRFTTGARRKQWHRNCVAVGLSSGFLEPLESTSIHLIQRSVLRFLRLLPMGEISESDVREYNAQSFEDLEQIRDFIILHYHVTDRRDTPFWRQCATMEVPDTLAHKLRLFRETGRVMHQKFELFGVNSWVQVMMGQGLMPETHHPIARKLSDEELGRFLGHLRENVDKTVATLPSHADYVARYCGIDLAKVA